MNLTFLFDFIFCLCMYICMKKKIDTWCIYFILGNNKWFVMMDNDLGAPPKLKKVFISP